MIFPKRAVIAAQVLVSVCSLGVAHITMAAVESEVAFESVQHERLFDAARHGDRIVAVGDLGLIMRSDDGGQTWRREKAPTDLALLGVTLLKDSIIVVGQTGLIMVHTESSGWEQVESGTPERLIDVSGMDMGLVYAVGAFGTVLRSIDYGQTWENAAPDWLNIGDRDAGGGGLSGAAGEPSMYAIQTFADGSALLGGELEFVLRSAGPCEPWEVVNQAQISVNVIAPTINALNIRDDGVGFAVGQAGFLMSTNDYGRSWVKVESPATRNLLAVASTDMGGVVAVGMREAVASGDDGKTWNVLNNEDLKLNWYSDVISSSDPGQLLAVGHSASIIRLNPQ